MVEVKEGKYLGRVYDHDLFEKDGQINSATVSFEFLDDQGVGRKMTWFGSLSANAAKYTIATLERMGFPQVTQAQDLLKLARGQEVSDELLPLQLKNDQDFELDIKPNTYNGKTSMRIDYINLPGQGVNKRASGTAASAKLAGLNIGAAIADVRSKAPQKNAADAAAEDLPF